MNFARLIYVPLPNLEVGERIARVLLEERLAACVNLIPGMRSVYRWQGAIESASEVVGIIKTTAEAVPAVVARIKDLHPYDAPVIAALAVDSANSEFLSWLAAEVHPQGTKAG